MKHAHARAPRKRQTGGRHPRFADAARTGAIQAARDERAARPRTVVAVAPTGPAGLTSAVVASVSAAMGDTPATPAATPKPDGWAMAARLIHVGAFAWVAFAGFVCGAAFQEAYVDWRESRRKEQANIARLAFDIALDIDHANARIRDAFRLHRDIQCVSGHTITNMTGTYLWPPDWADGFHISSGDRQPPH